MENELKGKLALIKEILFKQQTNLRDHEQTSKELGIRLNSMRLAVI